MLPVIILSEASAGSQITLDEMEVLNSMEAMWTAISTTVTNFFTSVLTPVINFATTNPLTLIFLGIGFIGISGICAVLLMRSGAVADRVFTSGDVIYSGGLLYEGLRYFSDWR